MRNLGTFVIIGLTFMILTMIAVSEDHDYPSRETSKAIKLPNARTDGGMSVEKALKERRSIRSFQDKAITLEDVSQLLWAAQGITDDKGHRTAPSAMAAYPLEVYLLAGNVIGLPAGTYHYMPQGHNLTIMAEGNKISDLFNDWRKKAPAIFVITGRDLSNFVYVEAGTAAENLLLEVVSLGLASTYTASFDVNKLKELLGLSSGEEPISVLPVGWKA